MKKDYEKLEDITEFITNHIQQNGKRLLSTHLRELPAIYWLLLHQSIAKGPRFML